MWKSNLLQHWKCAAGHVVTFDELDGRDQDPERDPQRWRNFCRALRRSWEAS